MQSFGLFVGMSAAAWVAMDAAPANVAMAAMAKINFLIGVLLQRLTKTITSGDFSAGYMCPRPGMPGLKSVGCP